MFLTLATDIIEPTPAVLIAISGLTYAQFRPGFDVQARLTIAAAALALASLVYQGLLFGFFFLPTIFPVSLLLSRRAILHVACLALAVPLISIALLSFNGDTPRNAARRFLQGEANTLASRQYSKPPAKNLAGVAIVGPAYAFASIPELRGLTGALRLLRYRDTIVLVVLRLGIRYVYPGLLGAVLLLSNTADIRTQIAESEAMRLQVASGLYSQLPATACFITNGWGPPVPDWRGPSVGWAYVLEGGGFESEELTVKANSQLLRDRLRNVFCTCPVVITDAFVPSNLTSLQQELSSFRIAEIPVSNLLVRSPESAEIFRSPRLTLYRFSPEDQQRACEALR